MENGRTCRRLGVIVTKRTGKAVVRNQWKRMIRERFRVDQNKILDCTDNVVIVRGAIKGPPDAKARRELQGLFFKAKRT